MDNAIKFNRHQGKILIKTWKNRGKVYVKIQDQGIGIPKGRGLQIYGIGFYQRNLPKWARERDWIRVIHSKR